ncbi:carbon-nitrogen hydrolase family protein [Parasphingopyxis sp.]|uniref:carbon-nitrogen hydrolase family protein n=1 Tax=Parasphingopyxis sp. TaxID=1920299 RepID=UPI0026063454|nr:carbon-nitrogen hydrolase family protein [Parasphingopyxis sp.]
MARIATAIVQAEPVPLDITGGIAALVDHVKAAADGGATVIAFGETFLGGYPIWLDEAPGAALWDHPGSKALHRILLDQAIQQDDERLAPLQELVDQRGLIVSVGAHERVRSSLVNTQFLFRPGQPPLPHRKLVPTHGERLIWARGDGSTLGVHETDWGHVGHLICWEHWMPLARAAMHNQREAVHVAAWPTVRDTYAIASRHYAFEGRCFVLAAGTVLHRDALLDGLERCGGNPDARALIEEIPSDQLQFGGSMIVAPNADILAEAGGRAETIHAELDLDLIGQGLASLDTDGHYARHDVFELRVNRAEQAGVVFED